MLVSLMIEGSFGLDWPRWQRMVRCAEDLRFDGIYRSDHFVGPPFLRSGALEAFSSLTWAADHTERIEIGTLVSPVSFRDPRILAWQATSVNDLAQGRLRLGLGTGWLEEEHTAFGFELGSLDERFSRLEEAIQVVKLLTRSDTPVSFAGERFTLREAKLTPRWPDDHSPAIIIGGNGPKRTLPLVAKYGDEWNNIASPNDDFIALNKHLDRLLIAESRDPASVRRTQMCHVYFDEEHATPGTNPEGYDYDLIRHSPGALAGSPSQMVDTLLAKEAAGIQGVMVEWLDTDDIDGLELFANTVLPQVR
ncbi:MAG: LLM class flavin-dependent oxidoreductase [Thermomicrobiales bacterium]|nr:LLM class flavin-dependent oxidoreductase [Thermomicrobiales bacterium]MCO5219442.1 LLM class flavin-dependent oxidoreductase [Thermomicrobiales bacterium]MCO5224636.1 LLM class flavin-dependent oxidoreductase [Thermomicrobiales bacterium]